MRAIFLASVLIAAAALSGCASVDKALFGGAGVSEATAEPSTAPASENPDAEAGQSDTSTASASADSGVPAGQGAQGEEAGPMPGTLPTVAGAETAPPPSVSAPAPSSAPPPGVAPAPVAAAPVGTASAAPAISPVVVAPGPNTGTPVNRTIAGLRGSLQDIAARLNGVAQQYTKLRASSAHQLSTYYQAQAQISAELQIGTARGNPELVAQWNAGQAALDQLTANVNALGGLATQVNGDASRTRTALGQIQSTRGEAGATDEDLRQLDVLEDEANQATVVLDRLARDISADVRRQAATLGNERTRLAQLANAIKAGDLYAKEGPRGSDTVSAAAPAMTGGAGQPIVAIRFARRNTDYQKTLYNALNRALQTQPEASFQVVGVSPTRGSAVAVQAAQNEARRHAQDVMHTMTEMGVPVARMEIASATDPSVLTSEVRVFVR